MYNHEIGARASSGSEPRRRWRKFLKKYEARLYPVEYRGRVIHGMWWKPVWPRHPTRRLNVVLIVTSDRVINGPCRVPEFRGACSTRWRSRKNYPRQSHHCAPAGVASRLNNRRNGSRFN